MPITGLEDDIQELAVQVLTDAAETLLDALKDSAPVGTGELRESAYGPIINEADLSAVIGFDAPQSDWTDQGTAPHPIDGNPLLRFFWSDGPHGADNYVFERVNHPGQTGTGWFSNEVDDWEIYVTDAAAAV